ncbi:ATPase [Clostridia bacterium]|nr:ATPase [Clostridia bacterium]
MKVYRIEIKEIFKKFQTSANGLSSEEVSKRLTENGKNELKEAKKKSMLARIWAQINDPMIFILAAAGLISGFFKEYADAGIIFAVIILNTILGIMQESKAENAIASLKEMSKAISKVRRDGKSLTVPSAELVIGDIVLLEAGDKIPADIRLIEAASLKIEEAALTGESVPSEKNISIIEHETPLGDRLNMAYMGTSVAYGRGIGVVVGTGMNTEMGKIADKLSESSEERTPLQQRLDSLGKVLSISVLVICVIIFGVDVLRFGTTRIFESFLTAISLAVAAIPEGLVVVVTMLLSIGVKTMSEKRAIIRRLTAIETLGCTQIICSDKTGTLTQNKMTVVEDFSFGETNLLKKIMFLCNDASETTGDPTEIALKIYGNGSEQSARIDELPFDSDRKLMSTFHNESGQSNLQKTQVSLNEGISKLQETPENNGQSNLQKTQAGVTCQYVKGAPDQVLGKCTSVLENGKIVPLTTELKEKILAENKRMADKALRIIAAAYRVVENLDKKSEEQLIFVGLTGMIDPIRPEVKLAISECLVAGIRPIMITGDHKDTAVAIGKELGIIENAKNALTGAQLDKISDENYDVQQYSVYARVSPDNKIRIVNAWKKAGKVVAMTGDGVNDAPSIKAADIGVGMGITGTDVTKGAADMVLADDNFATIVTAVGEGRRIYENIRKAVQFLLGSNLAEVIAIFVATIMGFVLLKPIHILWINLITDTFPAMALGMEKAEKDVMLRHPRNKKEGIFSDGLGVDVILQGSIIAVLTLISYFIGGMETAFVTLSMCEVFNSLNMRSRKKSIFTLKTHNVFLTGAMILGTVLTLGIIYIPGLNTLFSMTPLAITDLLISIGLAIIIIPFTEIKKIICK